MEELYDASGQRLGTTSKVLSGLGGGALGGGIAQIIAWILKEYYTVDMPVEIQMAIASVLSTSAGIAAAHWTPPNVKPATPAP